MRQKAGMSAMALALVGCITDPYSGQSISSRSTRVTVQGWAVAPRVTVEAHCRQYLWGSDWTALNTFTSSATAWDVNGTPVYGVTGSMVIPVACWTQWHPSAFATEVRFTQRLEHGHNATYKMYNESGVRCVLDQVAHGVAPASAAQECNPSSYAIIQTTR